MFQIHLYSPAWESNCTQPAAASLSTHICQLQSPPGRFYELARRKKSRAQGKEATLRATRVRVSWRGGWPRLFSAMKAKSSGTAEPLKAPGISQHRPRADTDDQQPAKRSMKAADTQTPFLQKTPLNIFSAWLSCSDLTLPTACTMKRPFLSPCAATGAVRVHGTHL